MPLKLRATADSCSTAGSVTYPLGSSLVAMMVIDAKKAIAAINSPRMVTQKIIVLTITQKIIVLTYKISRSTIIANINSNKPYRLKINYSRMATTT